LGCALRSFSEEAEQLKKRMIENKRGNLKWFEMLRDLQVISFEIYEIWVFVLNRLRLYIMR
jgi:hypothetical protein